MKTKHVTLTYEAMTEFLHLLFDGIPEDAEVFSSHDDPTRRMLYFFLESEEFDEILPGEESPRLPLKGRVVEVFE